MNKSLSELAQIYSGTDYKKNPPGDTTPIYGTGGLIGYTSIPLYSGPAVLSGRKGSINNPMYVEGTFWNVDTIFCIKAFEGIDTKWLYYNFLNTDLSQLNEATGVPSVNSKALYRLKFKWFELPEQRKIATILSTCDAVIEKTQAAIAKYKAIKQGMLHDLFTRGIDSTTGKLKPKYEDAPELYKESKLGWVPKEWEVDVFSKRVEIISGGTPSTHIKEFWGGLIPWLSVDDFNNGKRYVTKSNKHITEEGLKHSATNILQKGMIIISARGTVGVISQLGLPMTFNQSCYGLNSIDSAIDNDYIYYFLLHYKAHSGFVTYGSVFSTITKDFFDSIELCFPKNEFEKMEMVRKISLADSHLETEQNNLLKLQQIKYGLMADLLSGKKNVTVTEDS